MVAVNMTMLNTMSLLLGAAYSPNGNGTVQLQHNSQMSQSADYGDKTPCGCKDHPHEPPCECKDHPHEPPCECKDHPHEPPCECKDHPHKPPCECKDHPHEHPCGCKDHPHEQPSEDHDHHHNPDCCKPFGCHDPCVLDPPEVCIDPLQGIPSDDPSLTILVHLSWPRRDVFWFLDGFRRLLLGTRFRGKRQVGQTDTDFFSSESVSPQFTTTQTRPPPKLTTTQRRPPPKSTTTAERPRTPPQHEFTEIEIAEIQEFIEESQLNDIVDVLEKDTTQEQRVALEAGEKELTEKDTLELTIRQANITFNQSAPTLQHQLAFRRTDPISTRMARVGIIDAGATLNFSSALNVPNVATSGLVFIGPISDCEIRNLALLRPLLVECDDPNNPYRTLDGTCNNLINTLWGAAFTPYRRDLSADYFDGVSSFRRSVSGITLPSARLISTIVNEIPSEKSPDFSILHMTFGQFIDHDLVATPMARASFSGYSLETSPIKCCNVILLHPECAPISIPLDDPFYECYGQRCMEFVRSAPAGNCHLGPRQQINQQTAYLDASVVYGVMPSTTNQLRTFVNGLLLGQVTQEGQLLLPRDTNPNDGCNRPDRNAQGEFCFKAGDGRVNEQIQLTFLQTLWAREHNRVARILKECNPHWNDEKLFQETRRIIGAELQQVVYNEHLPHTIGPTLMAVSDLNPLKGSQQTTDYNEFINAAIANVFPTAAYRFGHSLIADNLLYITKYGQVTPKELSTLFFNPFDLYRRDGMCDVARGGIALPENKMDPYFTLEIAGKLFRGPKPFGLDLFALNIQRGRDHGLPPYNEWRKFCGLPRARDFQDLLPQMNQKRVNALRKAYQNVDDIDVYVGGVSENPIPGALVGHTFACIIHNQFLRIKRGDRYWFEYKNGPGAFTKAQIKQLHRVTLARIMCNNLPELGHVQRWPLRNLGPDNPKVCCKSIRQYNLDPWKEHYEEEEEDDHEHKKEDDCY